MQKSYDELVAASLTEISLIWPGLSRENIVIESQESFAARLGKTLGEAGVKVRPIVCPRTIWEEYKTSLQDNWLAAYKAGTLGVPPAANQKPLHPFLPKKNKGRK